MHGEIVHRQRMSLIGAPLEKLDGPLVVTLHAIGCLIQDGEIIEGAYVTGFGCLLVILHGPAACTRGSHLAGYPIDAPLRMCGGEIGPVTRDGPIRVGS